MLERFLQKVDSLLVVVSTLLKEDREAVVSFLLQLNAPVYLEAISGIREDRRLQHLQIFRPERIWEYPNEGILRIGGVPTLRTWRDLEEKKGISNVLSISHLPFTGLSWGELIITELSHFFSEFSPKKIFANLKWVDEDKLFAMRLKALLLEENRSEPGLLHGLSDLIEEHSNVYLGNSMPIREWDLAAGLKPFEVYASRGVNGIDGQISTFLGLCQQQVQNWAIIGDLTAIYDLAAPWIISQLESQRIAIVVINNGGGKIFERMFPSKSFQNQHALSFECLAKFWKLQYERWNSIPKEFELMQPKLIEILPDPLATERFWGAYCQ